MFSMKKWKWKPVITMKIPLFLAFLVIGYVPMKAGGQILLSSFRQSQVEEQMEEIQNQSLILSNKMTRSGYLLSGESDEQLEEEMNVIGDIFTGRIVAVDSRYRIVYDSFNLSRGKINVTEEVIRCLQGESSSQYYKNKKYMAITIPVYGDQPEKLVDGALMVIASTENLEGMADHIEEKSVFFEWVLIWLLVLTSAVAAMLFMRPFQRLQKVLNRVAEGNLDEDISENTYKETTAISGAIAQTISRLKIVDQSREEFVSNVSHELKTPITSIRVLADSLMSMEEVPVELYREFMSDISDEIDRESKIIDDLLSLVKMDKSTMELNLEQVDINRLVKMILKRIQPIAQKRNVELIFESIREVTADVDEVKLSLALNNLVENAVKYNVDGGWVRVILDADHKFFYVKVMDSGLGIPEEYQEYVFERFYRVDKARLRETGGTGLGLAITRKVILMHKGAIKLASKEGEGSTFTVRIPLTYIS